MKKALALFIVAGAAMVASAGPVEVGEFAIDRVSGAIRPVQLGDNSTEVLNTVYRNWAGGTVGGTGVYTHNAGPVNGASLNGDDTNIAANGVNLLSAMGINHVNLNVAGQRLVSGTGTINFFHPVTFANLGAFGYNFNYSTLAGGGLDGAGASIRLSFADGSLESLGIYLPPASLTTWTIDTAVFTGGGALANMGIQIRNPTDIGSSTDKLVLGSSVITSPYAGAPVGNTSIFIRTNSVPTPGALCLLGLGGLVAGRRRR